MFKLIGKGVVSHNNSFVEGEKTLSFSTVNGVQVIVNLHTDHLYINGLRIKNDTAHLHLLINSAGELSPYGYYRTSSSGAATVSEVSSTVPEQPNIPYCSQWDIIRVAYIQFCSFLKDLVQSDDPAQHQVAVNLIRILDL